jgi:hypothetical protein
VRPWRAGRALKALQIIKEAGMLKMTDVEMRKTGEASTGKRFMAMLTA